MLKHRSSKRTTALTNNKAKGNGGDNQQDDMAKMKSLTG